MSGVTPSSCANSKGCIDCKSDTNLKPLFNSRSTTLLANGKLDTSLIPDILQINTRSATVYRRLRALTPFPFKFEAMNEPILSKRPFPHNLLHFYHKEHLNCSVPNTHNRSTRIFQKQYEHKREKVNEGSTKINCIQYVLTCVYTTLATTCYLSHHTLSFNRQNHELFFVSSLFLSFYSKNITPL